MTDLHPRKQPEIVTSSQKERRQKVIMDNFKAIVFQSVSLSPEEKSVVEQCLKVEVFPSLCSAPPDHLPYPVMIESVMGKLNKPCNKETISQSIKEEYANLPWAHETLLEHHLQVLLQKGTIVKNSDGHYIHGEHAAAAPSSSRQTKKKVVKKHPTIMSEVDNLKDFRRPRKQNLIKKNVLL